MAEQFKKIYIPASEFVKAWEKEVYELTNMDYFIYLLMNSIAELLEHNFFPQQHNVNEEFMLDSDEITNLSFHIGDSVQIFFENKCFGSCTLNCPMQLDQKITSKDFLGAGNVPENIEFNPRSCSSKEECLKYDLMNFVLIDSIIDFYHFDLRVTADEGDAFLQKLIHFINDNIIELIKNEGHQYLIKPQENASLLFENLLDSEDSAWSEFEQWDDDDFDPDEPDELWKLPNADLVAAIEKFKELQGKPPKNSLNILELFANFITSYIGVLSVNDLAYDDLEEFTMVVLPSEFSLSPEIDLEKEKSTFKSFLSYVDYQYETNLSEYWIELFNDEVSNDLQRSFEINRKYRRKHSFVEFQISPERNDPALIEGFFEIIGKQKKLYLIKDIHLNDTYLADLSSLDSELLQAGDILNMNMITEQSWWKAVWVECVLPQKAKVYLI